MEILSRRQAIPFDCLVGCKGGMRHKGEREREKIKKILYLLMLLTVSSFWRRTAESLNLSDDSGLITAL